MKRSRGPVKVLAIFGTRPEAIKMAPVLAELRTRADAGDVAYAVCVTGQHRQMLDQVLDVFHIKPDYDLDLMTDAQSLAQVASAALAGIEPVLDAEVPDWAIVQGDTTTTAVAALAAHYSRVKVAHIEAGLRTHDKWQPFPEETNRRIAGTIADLHFAPTASAKRNLLREGVSQDTIFVTGNTSIDALKHVVATPPDPAVRDLIAAPTGRLKQCGRRLILVTAHRRENFGRPLAGICAAIRELASTRPSLRVVFPVHMNPSVRDPLMKLLSGIDNVSLVAPLDYPSLVHLMAAADLVLTDSGGIQEEAPALGKPVLVMRDVTERNDGVETGVARLVGTDTRCIVDTVHMLLDDRREYNRMTNSVNPYGDGRSSTRIVRALLGESTDEFAATAPK